MNKKILVLAYQIPPLGGGGSTVVYEIAKEYAQSGHKVDIVTMGYKNLPLFEKKDKINIYRVRCLRSKKEISYPWELLTYILAAKKFLKTHLKNHSYDINHSHFIIPTGIISFWLEKKYNLPYLLSCHGSDVPGYNKERFVFLHKFTRPLLKKICRKAFCLTAPSFYLSNLIKKNIEDYSIKIIPNGARDFFLGDYQKENIIFSSGRLLKMKGFHLLIKAFQRVKNKKWKLLIIGDGPYKNELKKLAGKDKNIVFTGWLDYNSKKHVEIINKAKIFALLSQFESQGIVFVEAMSAGCAILASNSTACRETVSKDVGFLVERENLDEITEKIKYLISNQEILNKFMTNSRKKYEENFQYGNIIKKYEKILAGKINPVKQAKG